MLQWKGLTSMDPIQNTLYPEVIVDTSSSGRSLRQEYVADKLITGPATKVSSE